MQEKENILYFFQEVLAEGSEEEKEIVALTKQAIEYMRKRNTAYLSGFLGLESEYLEDGSYRFQVPITPFMLNGLKIVHGGISATLADVTMGSLARRVTGKKVVTVEMNVHYLAPGKGKTLISTSRLLRKGKQLCVCECLITNEKGDKVLSASGTFFILQNH